MEKEEAKFRNLVSEYFPIEVDEETIRDEITNTNQSDEEEYEDVEME